MSRLITIITITMLALSISIIGVYYAKDTSDKMKVMTNVAIENSNRKDIEALKSSEKKLSAFFESRQPFLSLYVRHDEIEKLQILLADLPRHISNLSYDEVIICLNEINFTIEHIYKRELPSIDNLL